MNAAPIAMASPSTSRNVTPTANPRCLIPWRWNHSTSGFSATARKRAISTQTRTGRATSTSASSAATPRTKTAIVTSVRSLTRTIRSSAIAEASQAGRTRPGLEAAEAPRGVVAGGLQALDVALLGRRSSLRPGRGPDACFGNDRVGQLVQHQHVVCELRLDDRARRPVGPRARFRLDENAAAAALHLGSAVDRVLAHPREDDEEEALAEHPRGVDDRHVGAGTEATDRRLRRDKHLAVAREAQVRAARRDEYGAGVELLAAGRLLDLDRRVAVEAIGERRAEALLRQLLDDDRAGADPRR